MKITIRKLPNLTEAQIKVYKSQTCIRRNRESRGNFQAVLSATDADLDRRKP